MEQRQSVFESYLDKSKTARREKYKIHFFLPLWIPLCNKLQPFLSTMSTSALWLTSVVAILSSRRERARSNARSPLWSNSFSFPGSCREKFLHQHTVSREDNWLSDPDFSISSHTISDFSPITYNSLLSKFNWIHKLLSGLLRAHAFLGAQDYQGSQSRCKQHGRWHKRDMQTMLREHKCQDGGPESLMWPSSHLHERLWLNYLIPPGSLRSPPTLDTQDKTHDTATCLEQLHFP